MQKQTIQFAVEKKDGIVTRVGRSVVVMPKVDHEAKKNRKPTKWHEDKLKQENKQIRS